MRPLIHMVALLALAGCVSTTPKVDSTKMAEGYYKMGLSHLQEKNYELASVELNRSIQTDSKNKEAYYFLGVIAGIQGKFDAAKNYYKKAIDIDSDYAEAHNALGAVHSSQRQWQEAISEYQKALSNKLYATPHVTYYNMGRAYMEQKDYSKAVDAYKDAKRFVSQDMIIYELGKALLEAGRIKEAIAELQEGVGLAPQNLEIRFNLALAYLKDGNKKAALVEFKKVSELAPKSEQALKANDYIKTLR